MDLGVLESIGPVCPVCPTESPLVVKRVFHQVETEVRDGVLGCNACGEEFPVVDGLPFVVPNLQQLLTDQAWAMWMRRDLPLETQQILASQSGAGSAADTLRQQLSSYAWDHYGTGQDTASESGRQNTGIVSLLSHALDRCPGPLSGPILDVGGSTFELARHCKTHVVGLDLNIAMLRMAQEVADTGQVRFLCRQTGSRYQVCEFPASDMAGLDVSFVAADALRIPFAAEAFHAVVALNILDCVQSPAVLLENLNRVLAPGGTLSVSTPFDWQPTSTPETEWLGSRAHESDPVSAFAAAVDTASQGTLSIVAEEAEVPWRVRLHDRSVMEYRTHLFVMQKAA